MAAVPRYEDIVAWQLAYELPREVFSITAIGPASKDFKFRDQIRDSSASATRNIAEGFGRFRPAEFARFLDFARGSLTETLSRLAGRAAKTTTRLMLYLQSCSR